MRPRVPDRYRRVADRLTREDRLDLALAAVLALVSTVETLLGNYDTGPESAVVISGLALTLPLALRRRYPEGVYAAVLLVVIVQAAVLGHTEGVAVVFALLVATYTLAATRPRRTAVTGLLVLVPVLAFANWRAGIDPLEDLDFAMALVGGAWVAGRVAWSRQGLIDRLSEQAAELERRRSAESRAVAAEERARISRDLHDVVAHSVSVMVVQAEVGEAVLPDAERSAQAMRAVQDVGRATLAELRRLLGALDGEGAAGPLPREPSPGLRDAERLVDRLRAAGLDVLLDIDTSAATVPPGVDLTAYRVLQEALTNVLRHAGRTTVEASVRVRADEVVVDVLDHGPRAGAAPPLTSDGAGHGLSGIRQRVALYGGEVESGPVGAGFRVHARLPVQSGS